jgi:hypothetical protein
MKRTLIGGIFFLGGAIMFAIGASTDSFVTLVGMASGGVGTILLLIEYFSNSKQ